MEETTILRALGAKELYNSSLKDYDRLISLTKITSRINLIEHVDVVEKAITMWKELHPFLKATLKNFPNDNRTYFVLTQDGKLDNTLHNVKLLSYDQHGGSNAAKIEQCLIEMLVERELAAENKLDLYHELFWRLILFKRSSSSLSGSYEYTVIFMVHHMICEAKYKYLSLIELFDLIEDVYNGMNGAIGIRKPYNVLNEVEAYFSFNHEYPVQFTYPKIPKFINMSEAKQKSLKSDYYMKSFNETNKSGFIVDHDRQNYISIRDLIKFSQENSSKTKCFKFKREKFNLILKKCKQDQIKLNGCLNMVFILAHKMLYDKFGRNIQKLYYYNSISLRKYLNPEEEKQGQKFSYLVNCLPKMYEFGSSNELDLKDFWIKAKSESECFHSRLNDKEYLISWKWSHLCSQIKDDEMIYDYFCANLGELPLSLKAEGNKLISVKESYDTMRVDEDAKDGFVSIIISSIENCLYWSVIFNSYFISDECIDYLCNSILEILNRIVINLH